MVSYLYEWSCSISDEDVGSEVNVADVGCSYLLIDSVSGRVATQQVGIAVRIHRLQKQTGNS